MNPFYKTKSNMKRSYYIILIIKKHTNIFTDIRTKIKNDLH